MSVRKVRELAEEILSTCDDLQAPPTTLYDVDIPREMMVSARDVWPGDYIYKTGAWRRVQSVSKLSDGAIGHQVCIRYFRNITSQYLRPNEQLRKWAE